MIVTGKARPQPPGRHTRTTVGVGVVPSRLQSSRRIAPGVQNEADIRCIVPLRCLGSRRGARPTVLSHRHRMTPFEDLDARASAELHDAMRRAEHELDVQSFWRLLERERIRGGSTPGSATS